LVAGRGRYVDDLSLPQELHAAFLRSPHPHAAFSKINTAASVALPGVAAVFTSEDLAPVCASFQCVSAAAPGLVSPPQYALANGEAVFQGEPVAMAIAASRAVAEDAVELLEVDWRELPAVTDLTRPLAATAPPVHQGLTSNLAWRTSINHGEVDAAFAAAALVVEETFNFSRHMGLPLEPRSILASYDEPEGALLVYVSHQMPHQLALHLSDLLSVPLSKVRVICPDVGGGFGVKMHVYPDEIAVCAAAKLIGRPVKFIADRTESLLSDTHAREAQIAARMSVDQDGMIRAFDVHVLHGIGAYSVYPRSSTVETISVLRCIGAPYRFSAYRCLVDVALQNKAVTGQYRGVGHPMSCTVTERLVDLAASARGEDPLTFRRRNVVPTDLMPWTNPAGSLMRDLSHHACIERIVNLMQVDELHREITEARTHGRLLGLGFAIFVEFTATGSEAYGRAGVPVAALDTVTLTLGPSGEISASASVSEIGQGIQQGVAQVIADAVGVRASHVTVLTGDTSAVPHGGGAWASRGAAIGGEAAWAAGRRLREEILNAASALLQTLPDELDIQDGSIYDAARQNRMSLAEFARVVLFRGHELPAGTAPQLTVSHQYRRDSDTFIPTNGIQAALIEVDRRTGFVTPLKHWVVEDCGRVINPLLVDEQIRGGVVQGIGEALLEACCYNDTGHFTGKTLADYLVPKALGTPDIVVAHVETPYSGSALGCKGAGEAGTCAAAAAILNAINDALSALGARVSLLPVAPPAILDAITKAAAGRPS
jgi:carbon-monoxide dehydrogenase large subunit